MAVPACRGLVVAFSDVVVLVPLVEVDGQLVVVSQVVGGGHLQLSAVQHRLVLGRCDGELVAVQARGVSG